MTPPKKPPGKFEIRFCTECGYEFPAYLRALVNEGKPCFCEHCGYGINGGQPLSQPASTKPPAPSVQKPLQSQPSPDDDGPPPHFQPPPSLPEGLSPHEEAIARAYLQRIFTVLSTKMRARILKLQIPEAEKRCLLREFAHLTEEQQEEFMEELESINS